MNLITRCAIGIAVLAFVGWVVLGIYHAGGDVPPPIGNPDTKLTAGHAEGRRVGGKPSWSLDYDRLTSSGDSSVATLENVRHGLLYRRGKPYMEMTAKHVVINTLSNDFIVTGPLELTQNDGGHRRRLTSDAANYSGALQTLTLPRPATITSDGTTLRVKTVTINFRSGDMALGPIIGLF